MRVFTEARGEGSRGERALQERQRERILSIFRAVVGYY